ERYELYHFVTPSSPSLPELKLVPTQVIPRDRDAAIRLLTEHRIDIVVVLSPWPETFSFVAHEAVIAGASVVCLEDSGNVAALVSKMDSGAVLPTPESVIDFFNCGAAFKFRNKKRGASVYRAIPSGATASICLSHEPV